jgi:hypothetical protein
VPTTISDPGPDNKAGTADDGGSIAAFNLQTAYVGLPTVSFVTNWGNDSKYDTFEATMTKRTSNHWSAQASYSWTKSWSARTALNPNDCINANASCQDVTTDYSFKLNGSFDGPLGIKFSPVYRMQAGNNFNRTFVARLNYANPNIDVSPRGDNRFGNINVFDLRFDRAITFWKGRLSPFLDLYNITNANPEQDVTVTSGSSYLRPVIIVAPRVARIGAKFDW